MPDLSLSGLADFARIPQQMTTNFFAPAVQATDLYRMGLANQASSAQLPYVGPTANANLQQTQLQNQGLGIKNQYQPDIYKNQIKSGQLANQFKPFDELVSAQQAMNSSNRFGGAYQLKQALEAMAPAARQLWISQNQDAYNGMLQTLGTRPDALLNNQTIGHFFPGMSGGLASPNQLVPPGAPQPDNNVSPPPLPLSADQQQKIISRVNQLGSNTTSNPDNANAIANANLMSANKGLATNKTRNQLEGAIQVEDMLNNPEVQQQVVDASTYAGALGKGKEALAALSQKNPKAYENYLAFQSDTVPLLLNRIKTLDGMGATDAQREELLGMYHKAMNSLTSNPDQFITQFNKLGKTLSVVADAVQKSATPLGAPSRLSGFNEISSLQSDAPMQSKVINGATYHQLANGKWYAS